LARCGVFYVQVLEGGRPMTDRPVKCPHCGSEDTKLMWRFIEGVEIRYVYRCRRCGRYIKVGKEAGA